MYLHTIDLVLPDILLKNTHVRVPLQVHWSRMGSGKIRCDKKDGRKGTERDDCNSEAL